MFQAEGTANGKALRWGRAWHDRGTVEGLCAGAESAVWRAVEDGVQQSVGPGGHGAGGAGTLVVTE